MPGMMNDYVGTQIIVDPAHVAELLRSPQGLIVRRLETGATRVQEAAKRQVRRGHVHAGTQDVHQSSRPNLVDTIVKRHVPDPSTGGVMVRVGSDNPIALLHHEGTRPHVIVPRNKTFLRFFRPEGGVVFAKRVNHPGTKPNRYLTDNLHLAVE